MRFGAKPIWILSRHALLFVPQASGESVVHRLRCIWLWERVGVTQFLRGIDSARYGARQHHVHTRAMLANPFCQFKPVNRAWHLNVTENYINIGFFVQENGHCFVGIRSFDYPVSAISKILGNWHADQNVVLNDQDDFLGDVITLF